MNDLDLSAYDEHLRQEHRHSALIAASTKTDVVHSQRQPTRLAPIADHWRDGKLIASVHHFKREVPDSPWPVASLAVGVLGFSSDVVTFCDDGLYSMRRLETLDDVTRVGLPHDMLTDYMENPLTDTRPALNVWCAWLEGDRVPVRGVMLPYGYDEVGGFHVEWASDKVLVGDQAGGVADLLRRAFRNEVIDPLRALLADAQYEGDHSADQLPSITASIIHASFGHAVAVYEQ